MKQIPRSLRKGTQKLSSDLRAVVEDADSLLRIAVNEAGNEYTQARERLANSLLSARSALETMEQAAVGRADEARRTTTAYVQQSPWQALGLAAGIGLLAGLMFWRS
jgi:ElaB/YqjD/DUF883 family membrane-anchored ribosome-binding protein